MSKQNLDLLDLDNVRHLNAAIGWLGLGSVVDARTELDCIPPEHQSHPAVLEARWLVCAYEKTWHDALVVADQEIASSPETVSGWLHRAYALRRVDGGSLALAWEALFPAAEKFPSEHVVAYNLSCYACQMNDLDASRVWLQRAVKSGGKENIKKMALDDDDLKPLWPEIKHL